MHIQLVESSPTVTTLHVLDFRHSIGWQILVLSSVLGEASLVRVRIPGQSLAQSRGISACMLLCQQFQQRSCCDVIICGGSSCYSHSSLEYFMISRPWHRVCSGGLCKNAKKNRITHGSEMQVCMRPWARNYRNVLLAILNHVVGK